ncbi:MAG: metallopeptidase family protein [Caldisericaceae bacterium]
MENDVFLVVKKIVKDVINSLPNDFKNNLKNVEFIIEDFPSRNFLNELHLTNSIPFGLYVGIPLNKRGANYNWVLPDRIHIFIEPILRVSRAEGISFETKVRKVLLHEIGHYFGLGEEDLRRLGVY